MNQNQPVFDPIRDLPHHFRVFQGYLGKRMYLVFALTLLATVAESVGIMLLLPLFQTLAVTEEEQLTGLGRVLNDILSALGFADSVVAILLFVAAFFLFKGLFLFAAKVYRTYLDGQLMRELMGRMIDDYGRMRLEYYISRDTGHFINVINVQIAGVLRAFNHMISLGTAVVTATVYLVVAMLVAWRFGVMAMVLGGVLFLAFKQLNLYVRGISRKTSQEHGYLAKLLIQALHSFKYLASTAKGERVRRGTLKSIHRLIGYEIRKGIALAFTHSIREPVAVTAILVIVLVQMVWLHQPLAPMIVSIVLFHRGLNELLKIQEVWQGMLSFVGSLEMVRDEFASQAEQREPDGACDVEMLKHGIELKDVDFQYTSSDVPVLKGISLYIPARTTVAFVGESGAGKSTLVDLLTLMLKPTRGQVLIDGVPGESVRLATWRRQIGYVSQETVIFDDTVANNICLWEGDVERDPELFDRVREAARQAHIAHVIESLPNGYQTLVGDRGIRLSGGQRQRLFIARELFKSPSLLILDEATSALDSDSEMAIRESIDALRGQLTVVVIAHRLATIRNVDRVVVLDQGRVLEEGAYADLRDSLDSRFAQMVAAQTL
jgi:ABC-type multidrug transport system fused ATPase/permease subunit